MSFRDEEELDWGEEDLRNHMGGDEDADAVDTISLGDEEEMLQTDCVAEHHNEDAPLREPTPEIVREVESSPNKNHSNSLSSQSSAPGFPHLPPKPHTVVYGGRSRETIKAAAMSRPAPRSGSPPGSASSDLPPNWEVRYSELTVYYYHTALCASQIKKPTRDDARLDSKFSWEGEGPPPPGIHHSLSTRNAPSSRTAWPENSASGRHQKNHRTSTPPPPRAKSPSQRINHQEDTRRGRADSRQQQQQQPPRPRSLSPGAMLLPRRGMSPARGLARSGNDSRTEPHNDSVASGRQESGRAELTQRTRREVWDRRGGGNQTPPPQIRDHYSPEPEIDERSSRGARTGILQAPRAVGSKRSKQYDDTHDARGRSRYSPPPEHDTVPPKHTMRRSDSPPRRGGMRSDAILPNQYGRRSISPRPHGPNRNFERPPDERGNVEPRSRPELGRTRSDADLPKGRDSGRGLRDPRAEEYRGRDIRPSSRGRHTDLDIPARHRSGLGTPLGPEEEIFSPAIDEPIYPDVHPSRVDRFHARAEGPRPRMGPAQPDVPMNSPHLSPHALRNDAPLPRHDPTFDSRGGYSRNQRSSNPHHRRERSPPGHEHRPSPPENEFIPGNRNMMASGPQRREVTRSRDSNQRGRQHEERPSHAWERVEVPAPPHEEGRYDGRRQDDNGRDKRRRNEYPDRQHPSDEDPLFEGGRGGPAPYARPISPDAKRSYPPGEREWMLRQGHPTLSADMEVDAEPLVRPEPLPGWANFQRRDREERRGRGPQNWSEPLGDEQGAVPIDSEDVRKRRRVDDGAEVVAFSRDDHELARKAPHRSPVQHPKPQSPIISFNSLPNPAVPAIPAPHVPVDPEAARARAKDIASQLVRAAPGSNRHKSRFGAMPNMAGPGPITSLQAPVTDASSKPDTEITSIKSPELKAVKEGSVPLTEAHVKIGADSPSHQSDDSSAPLAVRLGDTSIGENAPLTSEGRLHYRQNSRGRWGPNSFNRNGGEFRGGRSKGDTWRPGSGDVPRDGPIRLWAKPSTEAHGDSQTASGFVPSPERTFIPRDAVERELANSNHMATREGLPPRPPAPIEFLSMNSAGGHRPSPSISRPQSASLEPPTGMPPPRDQGLGYDGYPTDASLDAQSNARKRMTDLSFRSASQAAETPRKNSLLDRMTEPGGGELSLMARLSAAEQGPHDGHQQRPRRPKTKQPGPRR